MTPPPYLVDTNVILALVRDNDLGKYLAATFGFGALAPRPCVSIVTTAELFALAGKFVGCPANRGPDAGTRGF